MSIVFSECGVYGEKELAIVRLTKRDFLVKTGLKKH